MRRAVVVLIAVAILGACSSSGSDAGDPDTASSNNAEVLEFRTDVEGLAELYPLPDIEYDSVRWRHHNDFVNENPRDDVLPPAQDADLIVEAVFFTQDEAVLADLAQGRGIDLTVPTWYPDDLVALANGGTTPALVSSVDGITGEAAVYTGAPGFFSVRYTPGAS